MFDENKSHTFILFIGRLLIAAIFLFAGVGKFLDYEGTAAYLSAKGIAPNALLVYGAGLVEIIGALSLIFGFKTRWGALLLILFLIPVSYLMHDFWNLEGGEKQLQMIHFLYNLAVIGGLLHVIAAGPGNCSCDARV